MTDNTLPEGRMTLEEWQRTKKYAVVTTIYTFRHRYAIPVDELQKLNTDMPVEGYECEWADDCVTMQEVREFSQKPLGEQIIDTVVMSEDEILKQFDNDNEYLASWTREKKINYIRNWKDTGKY